MMAKFLICFSYIILIFLSFTVVYGSGLKVLGSWIGLVGLGFLVVWSLLVFLWLELVINIVE